MKALIIVDVQNDFLINGSLEVPCGNDVIEPINEIIQNNDFLLLDGTFYRNDELPTRKIQDVPHPYIKESLQKSCMKKIRSLYYKLIPQLYAY